MIKEILDSIAAEPSTNNKLKLIAQHKDNETFVRVLYLAKSKRIKFYIKQIPKHSSSFGVKITLDEAMDKLSVLSNRELTGGMAHNFLGQILCDLSNRDASVIEKIIGKDLKIGVGSRGIEKVIPKLIEKTPYMGAIPYNIDKVKKLFAKHEFLYADVKMDGRYNNAIIRDGEVENESRQGELALLGKSNLVEELAKLPDCVLNGEFTISNEDNRYKANGIISSLIDIYSKECERTESETTKKRAKFEKEHGAPVEAFVDRIIFTVWDKITVDEYYDNKSLIPYRERWESLVSLISGLNSDKIKLVEKKQVYSYEEAMDFFQECLNNGLEGIILKSPEGIWENKKPDYQVKMKLEMELELRISGFNFGTAGTKNEKVVSSLLCTTEDGLIVTNPGGINEETMLDITNNRDKYHGSIITVKANGISMAKDGSYSLLHPRFICFRDDKSESNTLTEALEIQEMNKGLK